MFFVAAIASSWFLYRGSGGCIICWACSQLKTSLMERAGETRVEAMTSFAADRGRRTTQVDRWLAGLLGAEADVALVAVGGLLVLAALLTVIGYAMLRPRDLMSTARRADTLLSLDERLSTAAVQRMLTGEADLTRLRRAELVDKAAAAWILQGALDRLAARL